MSSLKIKQVLEEALKHKIEQNKTMINTVNINGKTYFLKIAGTLRSKFIKKEIHALQRLSAISPFYKNYLIDYLEKDGKVGIICKFIIGEELSALLKINVTEKKLLVIFLRLLKKLKYLHDNKLTHGDIKTSNIYAYFNKYKEVILEFIDFEGSNDFSIKNEEILNIVSEIYNFPSIISRKTFKSEKHAFLFYKFLDIYSLCMSILYIYNKKIYKDVKNGNYKWSLSKNHPKNSVQGQTLIEKLLYYVFNFLPYYSGTTKISLDLNTNRDIPSLSKMIDEIEKYTIPVECNIMKRNGISTEDFENKKKFDKEYRTLALKTHPDKGGNTKDFKKLGECKDKIYKKNDW